MTLEGKFNHIIKKFYISKILLPIYTITINSKPTPSALLSVGLCVSYAFTAKPYVVCMSNILVKLYKTN